MKKRNKIIKINDSIVIGNGRVPFIAEVGLCHNGSVDIAKALIDIAVKAGADIVKFQKRDVANLATNEVLDAADTRFPSFGSTYRQVREHIEFNRAQYDEIVKHCRKRGILFSCTPFDIASFEFLSPYHLELVKIASHSVTNLPLLEVVARTQKPTLMSTGMCTYEEIDAAVAIFEEFHCPLALFHCVSSYPTGHEEANLPMINELKERYQIPVGLSTHEQGILATISGVAMGADIIERHVTLDHNMEGFDHKIAVDPYEIKELISSIREVEKMLVYKEKHISESEMVTRNKYRVSAVAVKNLKKGDQLRAEDFIFKNPGTGVQPSEFFKLVGHCLNTDLAADYLLDKSMVQS